MREIIFSVPRGCGVYAVLDAKTGVVDTTRVALSSSFDGYKIVNFTEGCVLFGVMLTPDILAALSRACPFGAPGFWQTGDEPYALLSVDVP